MSYVQTVRGQLLQRPSWQSCPTPQVTPQAPQFCGSLDKSAQDRGHLLSPSEQTRPLEQLPKTASRMTTKTPPARNERDGSFEDGCPSERERVISASTLSVEERRPTGNFLPRSRAGLLAFGSVEGALCADARRNLPPSPEPFRPRSGD